MSDCDMSITQPGAAPPLRDIRQFDKFQDQLRAMQDGNDGLRNQAIFKIDDEDEERKVSYNDIVLSEKSEQHSSSEEDLDQEDEQQNQI